jgi:hypothetical protein
MRIEYEVDREDFAEASIAAAIPHTKHPRATRKKTVSPWFLWALVGAVLGFVMILYLMMAPRRQGASEPTEPMWAALLNGLTRYEWSLPWISLVFTQFVILSSRRGKRVYRLATLANLIVFIVLLALVLAANQYATERSPIADSGAIRLIPWILIGNVVFVPFIFVWVRNPLKLAFERSWYAGEPRVISFDEENVRDESDRCAWRYQWSVLSRVETTSRVLLLFNQGGQLVSFVPLRAIGDKRAVEALVEIIRSRIDGSRAFPMLPHDVPVATLALPAS